jgi:hypothetical protein
MKTDRQELTAHNLKTELWDTLKKVKAKDVEPGVSNAVATQSREIMRVVKMELTVAAMLGRKPSKSLIAGFQPTKRGSNG